MEEEKLDPKNEMPKDLYDFMDNALTQLTEVSIEIPKADRKLMHLILEDLSSIITPEGYEVTEGDLNNQIEGSTYKYLYLLDLHKEKFRLLATTYPEDFTKCAFKGCSKNDTFRYNEKEIEFYSYRAAVVLKMFKDDEILWSKLADAFDKISRN